MPKQKQFLSDWKRRSKQLFGCKADVWLQLAERKLLIVDKENLEKR